MTKKLTITLWFITGLTAIFLLAMTINIVQRANEINEQGFTGYVSGVDSVIYLRSRPSSAGSIVTILNLGQPVQVIDRRAEGGADWFLVEAGDSRGWLPVNRVTSEPLQGES